MSNRDEVKLVVLADWGYLILKRGVYDPLDAAFQTMLNMNDKIDGIYIGGDIAYDLDSYEGAYYEDFIIMLSQVGSRWPVIMNTGNHEHLSPEDEEILEKSFEIYGSMQNRLTVLNFNFVNWFMIDPYKIVFKQEDPTELLEQF